jgi:hypothetical protein
VQSESTYNWESEQWGVPVNAALSKLVMFGKLPVSLQAGVGYWADLPGLGSGGLSFSATSEFRAAQVVTGIGDASPP